MSTMQIKKSGNRYYKLQFGIYFGGWRPIKKEDAIKKLFSGEAKLVKQLADGDYLSCVPILNWEKVIVNGEIEKIEDDSSMTCDSEDVEKVEISNSECAAWQNTKINIRFSLSIEAINTQCKSPMVNYIERKIFNGEMINKPLNDFDKIAFLVVYQNISDSQGGLAAKWRLN